MIVQPLSGSSRAAFLVDRDVARFGKSFMAAGRAKPISEMTYRQRRHLAERLRGGESQLGSLSTRLRASGKWQSDVEQTRGEIAGARRAFESSVPTSVRGLRAGAGVDPVKLVEGWRKSGAGRLRGQNVVYREPGGSSALADAVDAGTSAAAGTTVLHRGRTAMLLGDNAKGAGLYNPRVLGHEAEHARSLSRRPAKLIGQRPAAQVREEARADALSTPRGKRAPLSAYPAVFHGDSAYSDLYRRLAGRNAKVKPRLRSTVRGVKAANPALDDVPDSDMLAQTKDLVRSQGGFRNVLRQSFPGRSQAYKRDSSQRSLIRGGQGGPVRMPSRPLRPRRDNTPQGLDVVAGGRWVNDSNRPFGKSMLSPQFPGRVVFHGTTKKRAKRIAREGFRPSKGHLKTPNKDRVFVTSSRSVAEDYAAIKPKGKYQNPYELGHRLRSKKGEVMPLLAINPQRNLRAPKAHGLRVEGEFSHSREAVLANQMGNAIKPKHLITPSGRTGAPSKKAKRKPVDTPPLSSIIQTPSDMGKKEGKYFRRELKRQLRGGDKGIARQWAAQKRRPDETFGVGGLGGVRLSKAGPRRVPHWVARGRKEYYVQHPLGKNRFRLRSPRSGRELDVDIKRDGFRVTRTRPVDPPDDGQGTLF